MSHPWPHGPRPNTSARDGPTPRHRTPNASRAHALGALLAVLFCGGAWSLYSLVIENFILMAGHSANLWPSQLTACEPDHSPVACSRIADEYLVYGPPVVTVVLCLLAVAAMGATTFRPSHWWVAPVWAVGGVASVVWATLFALSFTA